MLPVSEGDRILDVGIGTGSFGGLLAQRGARIWGVDVSPRMLERCQEAYPDFTLAESSFLPPPFSEGSFEAVVASFAFHEVAPAERSAALAEVARVLVPCGYICLLDIIFASPEAAADAAQREGKYWDDSEEYPQVADLDRLLRQAGFAGLCWRQTAPCHWVVTGRRI